MNFSHPQINQPLEALYHIRCSMEAAKERGGTSDLYNTNPCVSVILAASFLYLPFFKRGLYISFAVCLARSRIDDVEAKTSLSRIIRDPTFDAGSGTTAHHVQAKVYLARVFRRLGEDSEAHKLYVESWPLVSMISDKTLGRYGWSNGSRSIHIHSITPFSYKCSPPTSIQPWILFSQAWVD